MEYRFKCCRKETVSTLYCVSCGNVFHKECAEKRKDLTRLDKHKIMCSKKCSKEDKVLKLELQIEELTKTIDGLQQELEEKDMYISKLRRMSQAFEADVLIKRKIILMILRLSKI